MKSHRNSEMSIRERQAVDADSLALDYIHTIGPGGHHLDTRYTLD